MKTIWTVASVLIASTLTMATSASALASSVTPTPVAKTAKALKPKPVMAKQEFRYLDMVEKKHPSSIRKAVIVYDFGGGNRKCDATDGKSVSECLRAPST